MKSTFPLYDEKLRVSVAVKKFFSRIQTEGSLLSYFVKSVDPILNHINPLCLFKYILRVSFPHKPIFDCT
jgi:hypothetical protein